MDDGGIIGVDGGASGMTFARDRSPPRHWSRSDTGGADTMPDEPAIRAKAPPARAVAALTGARAIPRYLEEVYWWAYLRPASIALFDHTAVVSTILWGRYQALARAALAEIRPGQRVLQAACVYGDFSPRLARAVGPEGRLDIIDIAPIQTVNCRRKLGAIPNVRVRVGDAAAPGGGPYDAVLCFFLLHEVPDDDKRRVVDGLLQSLAPGGRAVFVDYHGPHRFHPLRPLMCGVFRCLEPFAMSLWRRDIADFASRAESFTWRKATCFGGLYQKVVATRIGPAGASGRAR